MIAENELKEHYIISSLLSDQVVKKVRHAIIETAILPGEAGKIPADLR